MKHFLRICLLGLLLMPCLVKAGGENFPAGSRFAGLAHAALTLPDHWATFHNQAALAELQSFSVGFYAQRKFSIKELNAGAISVVKPFKNVGTFGLSFYQFNNSNFFYQQRYGLTYARSFGDRVSAGIQFDAFNTFVRETGNQWDVLAEAGLLFHISEKVDLAAHVFNPTNQQFASYQDEPYPTVFRLGTGFDFSEKLTWLVEGEKPIEQDLSIKNGLEYHPGNNFHLRGGFATKPLKYHFGLGFDFNNFRIDIAFSIHQKLGFTPNLGTNYITGLTEQ